MPPRKGFSGTRGRPLMKVRGFDGTAAAKRRIEELRAPATGTWAMLPAAAACDRELGQVTPLHVLTMLCKYRNTQTGECFPSMKRLARDLGVKDRRSVQRHIDSLVACGYVVVLPRRTKDGRNQTSNAYVVLYPPLLLPDDAGQEDEGTGGGPAPAQNANPPEGQIQAKIGGVTPSATGEGADPPKLPPEMPATPWQTTPKVVTHDGDPRDTMCRSNYPTGSIPSGNDPLAEANARAREPIPGAKVNEERFGEGSPSTEPADRPLARQDVPLPKARDMRPAPRPHDPVADVVRWITEVTGQHPGPLWAAAVKWHDDLELAGFTADASNKIIAEEGATARQHGTSFGNPVDMISKGVRYRIEARKLEAP